MLYLPLKAFPYILTLWQFRKALQCLQTYFARKTCLLFYSLFKKILILLQFSSVAQSSPTLRPHKSQHARPPCPSPTPRVHSDSCPLSQWCHPTISSSVVPFSSCPQSLPASESSPMSQLFAWILLSIP